MSEKRRFIALIYKVRIVQVLIVVYWEHRALFRQFSFNLKEIVEFLKFLIDNYLLWEISKLIEVLLLDLDLI